MNHAINECAQTRTETASQHWVALVEQIRREHNGVFAVRLFFGHHGHTVCAFDSYEKELYRGESGRSMQEAVERCMEIFNNPVRRELISRGRINSLGVSYPYDGHWPLTENEQITLWAEEWYKANQSRFYALGVGPARPEDFIVLLSSIVADRENQK